MPFPGPRRVLPAMIDPATVGQVAMLAVAAVAGGAVGGWRALKGNQKEKGTDEVSLAMTAQRERIDALIAKNQELVLKVQVLEREVAALRAELDIEKRITRRLAEETGEEPTE